MGSKLSPTGQTYISLIIDINSGKMTEALILVDLEAKGVVEGVMSELGKMEEIECVAFITGPYDVMVIADGDMHGIITKIREIDGVKDTTTNVIIAEHISKGLEKKL